MQKIDNTKKQQTKGGLSEMAIFSIITAVGAGISLITNIATGALNAEANKKQKANQKMMNLNYQKHAAVAVY